MRRLTMFEGGILSSTDHEQVARSAAIAAMASRIAAAGLTTRTRQSLCAEAPAGAPDPTPNPRQSADSAQAQTDEVLGEVTASRMRQVTVVFVMAAMAAGLLLYREKSRAAMLDHEIGRVIRATEDAHKQTGLLRAEWASLNEPERLRSLADRYLQLRNTEPSQFVELSRLSHRLSTLPPISVQPIPEPPPADVSGVADDAADSPPVSEQSAVYKASAEIKLPAPDSKTPAPRSPELRSPEPKSVAGPSAAKPPATPGHLRVLRAVAHVTPPPPVEHAEPKPADLRQADLKPRVVAHHLAVEKVAEKIALPKWLTQGRAAHPAPLIMSEPPHLLGVPHSAPLPLAVPKPAAATALGTGTPPADAAPEPRQPEIVAESQSYPARPSYSPPVYRQPYGYYGYGYGYGTPYRVPYAPPYGGYYGGQYPGYR
jgi:hypothetical protein